MSNSGALLIGQLIGKKASILTNESEIDHSQLTWIHISGQVSCLAVDKIIEEFPLTYGDLENQFLRLGIEYRDNGFALLTTHASCGEEPMYFPLGIFVTKDVLVTIAPQEVPEVTSLFHQWILNPVEHGLNAGALLYSILDLILDSYFPVLDTIHDRIEDMEDDIFKNSLGSSAKILQLKKFLLVMRKQISPIRENVNSLIRLGQPIIAKAQLPEYQDLYNHSLRISENIDTGRDIITGLLDVQLNVASNRLNEVMRTLTVISTILMSSALIAGIYGMNFKHMPELDWMYGYPFSIGLMLLTGIGIYFWFKKLGFVTPKT
ncbi:MAG: magnesium/cobalt transporter CorA [Fimbriimonadaceae bacterium]|nr:MAG: magnesium/cobalt transporter CorA [Fimbriimonadaceae bacterium]